jgi:hypothetical protein
VLRSRKQRVYGFFKGRICCQSAELTHHCAGNWKPARDIFHLRQRRLLCRANVNEQGDEDQERVPKQSEKPKDERKSLPNSRGDLSGARITHLRGEECA